LKDLTASLDKLHTTELGKTRIKRNLNLQADDVVGWCKDAVRHSDIIIRQGKNWYVYGAVLSSLSMRIAIRSSRRTG
jgi:hypothetical protein